MPTRDELIAAATEIHDREGCGCDRRYLMSCTRLAAAILRAARPQPAPADGEEPGDG